MEIIPAIDIIGGKCVRLTKGDYAQMKVYNEDPLEIAKMFEDHGFKRLHLVDLDGAKAKKVVNYNVLENVAGKTSLFVDFGGGVQSDDDVKIAFDSGAKQITGGSIAVRNPEIFEGWLKRFGAEKIILGADARDKKIAVSGWQEDSELDIFDFLESYQKKSVKYVISTDVSKDGMLQGPSVDLYNEIMDRFDHFNLIASGGVSEMKDIEQLAETPIYGVIIGKAIYEGRIDLKELSKFVE